MACFDEEWANHVVSELGLCNPAYGKGTQVEYDDYQIEMEMQRRLIQGKAFLEGVRAQELLSIFPCGNRIPSPLFFPIVFNIMSYCRGTRYLARYC